MKRIERNALNHLKKTVNENTIGVEIPVEWTHEGKQAIHEMLTIEKGMFALCIMRNDIKEEYCIYYIPAIRRQDCLKQENRDIDDIVNEWYEQVEQVEQVEHNLKGEYAACMNVL